MKTKLVATAALMLAAPAAPADSLRCGTELITEGDLVVDLLEHCGEPTLKKGNEWLYDTGDSDFITVVTFLGNDVDIDRIDRRPRD